ncbi:hypothetical protein [Rhizobium sp. L43]|uniref:hypothetical protein n=1 Tax=Rhizobium sp. L43 TaxID=2035452 RepID=UPI000BE7C50D|nr:hypothetical protein [Rhizobium sp. L43]PDS79163.1 hypothetical protein CO667_10120 [Rhizobium sp. L43]
MTLSKLSKLTHPFYIRGAELTARALTIADSKRLGRRFPHLDLVKVLGREEVPGMPLVSTSPASRHALVATCLGHGGDPAQEAAVDRLTRDEQAEIIGAALDLTLKNLDLKILKEWRNGRKRIRLRGVKLEVRPLSPQLAMALVRRFPDFMCFLDETISTDQLLDSSEPALNALIAAGLGRAGDPVEEEAASRLTMLEQSAIIVYMFGLAPEAPGAPARLSGLN